jgi:hypothetical protein
MIVLGMALVSWQTAQQTEPALVWKTFTNRAGWSIQYPANWTIGSCHSCSDPAAENVFVTFSDPHRATDSLMIEHLISKPADKSDSQWLQEMSKNPNARTSEEALPGARPGGRPPVDITTRLRHSADLPLDRTFSKFLSSAWAQTR